LQAKDFATDRASDNELHSAHESLVFVIAMLGLTSVWGWVYKIAEVQ